MLNNLSLLPHDQSIIIKDITKKLRYIQLMKALLGEFQQALVEFENQQFNKFDAQVGDTLCQIRAYKIYTLSVQTPPLFKAELVTIKDRLTQFGHALILQENNYHLFLKTPKNQRPACTNVPIPLIDFFLNMDCFSPLSNDALTLFLSYFLFKYQIVNEENIPIGIDYKAIAKQLNLSNGYSKKLGQYYQKMLSELSCDFVFELLQDLPEKRHLSQVIPWLHRKSDEGRMVLPCTLVTEIIILHMIKTNAKAIVLVNLEDDLANERIAFGFEGSNITRQFKHLPEIEPEPWSCMVFYGVAKVKNLRFKQEWVSKFHELGLKDVVLYNNAAHPQYSGVALSAFRENPFQALMDEQPNLLSLTEQTSAKTLSDELSTRQALALRHGCTLTDPHLFFLKHIFCNTTEIYAKEDWASLCAFTGVSSLKGVCAKR